MLYKSDPPLCIRARDLLYKVLAKKVQVILLCTTVACPFKYPCIILPFNWLVVQEEPRLLDWDLLTMKGSGPAFARIIQDPYQLGPVCRKGLCDQGMGGEINSWAIIMVKNQSFEITPHCLNYHSGSLSWDGVGMCQSRPEFPFVRGIPTHP